MLKRTINISVTLLLSFIMIAQLGYLVRPTDTDGAYDHIETFHSLPNDSLDVIVYGSSAAFRGIDTLEMSEKYGFNAYNYGWHWQRINTTKLFIEDSLIEQQPKVAIIETLQINTVTKGSTISPEIYYSRYIKNAKAKRDYLRECFEDNFEGYFSYFVPLWGFHDNWNTLTQQSFSRLNVSYGLLANNGYQPLSRQMQTELLEYDEMNQEYLCDESVRILDDIVETLHSRDIKVLFVSLPYRTNIWYGNALQEYARTHNCQYIDLYRSISDVGINGKTDFYDETHLNASGATKAADYIGKYIVENYQLYT